MSLIEEQICSIEETIGCRLPPDVRAAYSESDGLLGPTDCYLLYPLHENRNHQIGTLNRLREEDWFPDNLRSLALLGDDGCGNLICYDPVADEAILWNPEDGDSVQERRPTVTDIWNFIRQLYEESETEAETVT
jgi:cell wall assembly regulator SMI1